MESGLWVSLICITILAWVWQTINWLWFTPRKLEKHLREQGLDGSSYKFLFGDSKEILQMRNEARENPIPFTNDFLSRVYPFHYQQFNKYGKNCFTWQGPTPMIHIAEPALIRDAYCRMNEFQKIKLNPLITLLIPGIVSYEGEKWSKHRKLINPAFYMKKLKLMLPAMGISVTEMTNKWEMVVSKTGSTVLDVFPYLKYLSEDVISRAAFGGSFEDGRRISELLKEQTRLLLPYFESVYYIPGWRYVPTKRNKMIKEVDFRIQKLLMKIINKREKEMEAGEASKDDLLGMLMDSTFKASHSVGTHHKKELGMSYHDLIDECKLFYFAGQESTSLMLVWTVILLSKHQDWQRRAREEVLETFGNNQPNFDGLSSLKTVTMILHEVLRLYPPVCELFRTTNDRETKLGNLCIPPGCHVSLPILQTHHDPKIWGDDASEFKPERFAQGIVKATKGNNAFLPFGCGPRICMGQNFSILEAKMALSIILPRFAFELSSFYTHGPSLDLLLEPQYGAPVILHRL